MARRDRARREQRLPAPARAPAAQRCAAVNDGRRRERSPCRRSAESFALAIATGGSAAGGHRLWKAEQRRGQQRPAEALHMLIEQTTLTKNARAVLAYRAENNRQLLFKGAAALQWSDPRANWQLTVRRATRRK